MPAKLEHCAATPAEETRCVKNTARYYYVKYLLTIVRRSETKDTVGNRRISYASPRICTQCDVKLGVCRQARSRSCAAACPSNVAISSRIEGIEVITPVTDDFLATTKLNRLGLAHDYATKIEHGLNSRGRRA